MLALNTESTKIKGQTEKAEGIFSILRQNLIRITGTTELVSLDSTCGQGGQFISQSLILIQHETQAQTEHVHDHTQ